MIPKAVHDQLIRRAFRERRIDEAIHYKNTLLSQLECKERDALVFPTNFHLQIIISFIAGPDCSTQIYYPMSLLGVGNFRPLPPV